MKNGYASLSFLQHFFRRFIAELGPVIITTFRIYLRFKWRPSSFTDHVLVTGTLLIVLDETRIFWNSSRTRSGVKYHYERYYKRRWSGCKWSRLCCNSKTGIYQIARLRLEVVLFQKSLASSGLCLRYVVSWLVFCLFGRDMRWKLIFPKFQQHFRKHHKYFVTNLFGY